MILGLCEDLQSSSGNGADYAMWNSVEGERTERYCNTTYSQGIGLRPRAYQPPRRSTSMLSHITEIV